MPALRGSPANRKSGSRATFQNSIWKTSFATRRHLKSFSHMKYPVMRTNTLMAVFPHIPQSWRSRALGPSPACEIASMAPELTT